MNILSILYNLFIMPIQIIVEMTYSVMSRFLNNKGLAIIAVSLVIQTLVLPLYKRSDALQEEERKKQESMSHWVKHIKKTFKGDERFMMLSTYYKQQNYKTIYALKSSFSILLQIPFFLAAYNYLSNLQELRRVPFLFIYDLGRPDAAITAFGYDINVLPLLMTLFNIISGIIYTRGLPVKSKVQVYGLAAVFLVLLYNSPSGLVLYWTMNNLFSLLKNVFMKVLKHPMEVLGGGIAVLGMGLLGYFMYIKTISKLKLAFVLFIIIIAQLPWLAALYKKKRGDKLDKIMEKIRNAAVDKTLFFWEMICLAVFMGAMIPTLVLGSSASEFIINNNNPIKLIWNDLSIYAGIFIIWFSIFYYLMKDELRKLFTAFMAGVIGMSIFNYMKYSKGLGVMNQVLVYDDLPMFSRIAKLINLLIIIAIFVVLYIIVMKKSKLLKPVVQILIIAMVILSVRSIKKAKTVLGEYEYNAGNVSSEETKIINLSKDGNNVCFIMLDRAITAYIPYIFEEYPEIAEKYEGFTYYPNTLTYGPCTNYAAPALFGGYEYTPTAMNERDKQSLADKHNEALLLMPKIFANNGYNVTVCDPPYAGYKWNPVLGIYSSCRNTDAYITQGTYSEKADEFRNEAYVKKQSDNFIYFSMVKSAPLFLQGFMYNNGEYFSCNSGCTVSDSFLSWYTPLVSMKEMTNITEDDSNNLWLFQNSATHDTNILDPKTLKPSNRLSAGELLDSTPKHVYNGVEMTIFYERDLAHYQSNAAALMAVGEWLDYLREQDVFDNTKIIIASDHGFPLNQFENLIIDENVDVESFSALLMVKDYNSTEFTISNEFMTTADVPVLLFKDTIENPVNPFTGVAITDKEKYAHPQRITTATIYDVNINNGNVFDTSGGYWYDVWEDIYNKDNWKKVEE